MTKKKQTRGKLGAPSEKKKIKDKKKKNPFLKNNGGFDLIDEDVDDLKYSIEKNGKIGGDKL